MDNCQGCSSILQWHVWTRICYSLFNKGKDKISVYCILKSSKDRRNFYISRYVTAHSRSLAVPPPTRIRNIERRGIAILEITLFRASISRGASEMLDACAAAAFGTFCDARSETRARSRVSATRRGRGRCERCRPDTIVYLSCHPCRSRLTFSPNCSLSPINPRVKFLEQSSDLSRE